jgi:RND family efflux transporter MFP subunit
MTESNATPRDHRRASHGRIPLALGGMVVVIGALVLVLGVLPAFARRAALNEATAERVAELPRVVFVETTQSPGTSTVVLPARLDALQETKLYAQMGGYLGPMMADLGDVVRAGQVLVEIETPILDRQLEQNQAAEGVATAKIDLAKARLDLAKATLARLQSVGDSRAISKQAIDEAAANEKTDAANLQAARADLAAVEADGRRLQAQKQLARIVAPFDGEITARGFDAGALVVADKTDAALPIFTLTNREEIRAFVDVPQSWSAAVQLGEPIAFSVKELRHRTFNVQVARMAPNLNETTRTRLVEARIPNADHQLLPGMFAEATLTLTRPTSTATVPGEAIVIRDGKTTLAVIGDDDTLRYLPVDLGRDTGLQVEVLTEIPPRTRVAVNLAKHLPEGSKVRPIARAKS